jgi:hemerythrin-like domain-containing protein
MCEYCGCREVEPIGELMDEHTALMDHGDRVRQALSDGNETLAIGELTRLAERLVRHVRREEAGIFTALRDQGEFLDELAELEAEHRQLDHALTELHGAPDFANRVTRLLDDLGEHVEREDLGIFPVSVATLGASGWQTVDRARTESPSFLLDARAPDASAEPRVRPA